MDCFYKIESVEDTVEIVKTKSRWQHLNKVSMNEKPGETAEILSFNNQTTHNTIASRKYCPLGKRGE